MTDERRIFLVRHGETEWSAAGKHTSTTDLPLTAAGEAAAHALGPALAAETFAQVLVSPRLRARRTAELLGFSEAEIDSDLAEWNYGELEGLTTAEIRETIPGWTVWSHPSPGGESAIHVGERINRVIARALEVDGDTLVIGHGHTLRVLAARWIGLLGTDGRHFRLDTSTLSILGYERETPVVLRWNSPV